MKFRATILKNDKTATGIAIPPEILEGLGAGKRPPIKVTLNGYTFHTTPGTVDGRVMLGVSADVRAKAKVAGGDVVTVDIVLDTEPRVVDVPADFAQALKGDATAKKFFDGLTASQRKGYVVWIEDAKKEETRTTRVVSAVKSLHAGKKVH